MNQSTSYVPNEDTPIRIDDTHNFNAEHENVEANTEYDPNYRIRTDSDENEIERNDEDIWYATNENDDNGEEPTLYDSGMLAGDTSFDHHNEVDLITNELINVPHIKTEFYEPRQRNPQKSDVRKDWNVPGVGDFFIESIPSIIPSIDEHELYKGAMFKQR